jgi:hypothetical protein
MAEFVALPDLLTAQLGNYSQVGQGPGWISPIAPFGGGSATVIVNVQQATFVLRGFYPTSGQYEVWSGTSRNTPPPSGHTLNDITVIAELVGTGTY